MKRYFIKGKEFSQEIAEATKELNKEIIEKVANGGDMNELFNVCFVTRVDA